MAKKILYLIIFISINSIAQNLEDVQKDFLRFYGSKNEVDIRHLKQFGFHDVYKYDKIEFKKYRDSTHIISKIKNVTLLIDKNTDLKKVLLDLSEIPTIKYLKFLSPYNKSKRPKKNLNIPKEFSIFKNLHTIVFQGDLKLNFSNCFNVFSKITSLKNLGFYHTYNNSENIFKSQEFLKMNFIKGFMFSGSKKINFPMEINQFVDLETLILTQTPTIEIHKFSSLSKIETLNLSYLKESDTLYNIISNFKNLKNLSLSSVKLNNFEFLLSKKLEIEELSLSNNKLETLPKEIGNLKKLKLFYSSNNKFSQKLPTEFYKLKNLKNIEIQGSNLEIISNELNNLANLESLKLYFNKVKILPKNIAKLTNLKKLYLNNNKINKLPQDIGKLKISKLTLDNNSLKTLPNSIVNLKNLDTLILEENYITKLPKKMGKLKKLKYLNLELNNLTKLPNSISKLENLELLNISRNEITELPTNFGNLSSLKRLDAEFCHLKKLPKSFGNLKNLEKLYITNNNLLELSKNFGALKKLETLYLHNRDYYDFVYNRNFVKDSTIKLKILNNNITKLPTSFSELENIKDIRLSLNKNIDEKQLFEILKKSKFKNYSIKLEACNIKELPKNGWDSIKVASLDLEKNLISEIPKNIVNAKYLKTLDLTKNKGISTYRDNKTQLDLLFVEEGFIDESSIEKTDELVIAYAKTANRKTNTKEYKKAVEYAEKALSINDSLAHKYLYEGDYIKALYFTENYKKVILISDIQIKKDTSQNIRFLNSIVPNFQYQAKSYLALNDTIVAVEKMALASKKFSSNNWTEAGMLAKKIGKDSLSNNYFENSYKFYTDYLKNRPKAAGYHLSLIESYIIGNKIDLAKKHLLAIKNQGFVNKDYFSLVMYFKIIISILKNDTLNFDIQKNELKEYIEKNNVELKSWSFLLIKDWLLLKTINQKQTAKINSLNNLF